MVSKEKVNAYFHSMPIALFMLLLCISWAQSLYWLPYYFNPFVFGQKYALICLSACAVVSLSRGPFSQPHFPTWTPDSVSFTAIARLIWGMWVVLAKIDEALVTKGISRRAVSTLLPHLHSACATGKSRRDWVDPEMHLVKQQQGIFERTNTFHFFEKHACNDTCAVAIGMVLLTLPWYTGVHLYERKEWRAEVGS